MTLPEPYFHDANVTVWNHDCRSMAELPDESIQCCVTCATQPYKGAHFATFPEALPERCIKAATPEAGCCPKCGSPWERVVERENGSRTRLVGSGQDTAEGTRGRAGELTSTTLGWKATCKCGLPQAQNVPSVALDPFAGSGTTLAVAKRLGCHAVGYELSKDYCVLAQKRIERENTPLWRYWR